jgi:hypothetical protein
MVLTKPLQFIATLSSFSIALIFAAGGCFAQKQTMGPVTVTYKHFEYGGSTFTAEGGVTMKSSTFDLSAQTVVFQFGGKGTPNGITKATADGDLSAKQQVVGVFTDMEQARTYRFIADHAVYVPDPSRPKGGTVDFTGNVTLVITAQAALAEPSQTHLKHARITLGPAPDYPRIDGEDGETVLTPLH